MEGVISDQNVIDIDTGEEIIIHSVKIGTWLVVNFPSPKLAKGKNYIGLVKKVGLEGEAIANFVRPKETSDFNSFIYSFPDVPDETPFSLNQIKEVLETPESHGRGYFKFQINWKNL